MFHGNTYTELRLLGGEHNISGMLKFVAVGIFSQYKPGTWNQCHCGQWEETNLCFSSPENTIFICFLEEK